MIGVAVGRGDAVSTMTTSGVALAATVGGAVGVTTATSVVVVNTVVALAATVAITVAVAPVVTVRVALTSAVATDVSAGVGASAVGVVVGARLTAASVIVGARLAVTSVWVGGWLSAGGNTTVGDGAGFRTSAEASRAPGGALAAITAGSKSANMKQRCRPLIPHTTTSIIGAHSCAPARMAGRSPPWLGPHVS